jgi:hypothetical protein
LSDMDQRNLSSRASWGFASNVAFKDACAQESSL